MSTIQPYPTCSSSLPQGVRYVIGDSGYDDHKLYNLSIDRRGFELVCPVSEIYNNTSLIEHIKSFFRIDPLPVRGYQMSSGIVLLSVLLPSLN
jgi:hypothetical protein